METLAMERLTAPNHVFIPETERRNHRVTAPLARPHLASIDIGSHTIRLLAARLEDKHRVVPAILERRITRLARGFQNGEPLKESGIQSSLSVLEEYAGILGRAGVDSIACGATGVVRRAENRAQFLHAVKEATGFNVSILSESTEAYLSAKGSLSVLPPPQGLVVTFDLGGSSTEFLLADAQTTEPLWSESIFTGAATITEKHLSEDHSDKASLKEARAAVRKLLMPVVSSIGRVLKNRGTPLAPYELVGTAGTVTTLAAMFLEMRVYEPYRVNGLVLSKGWIEETVELLASLPIASRRHLPGLEEGREDIILGGALIVREILETMNCERFTVTDGGLLEGLLIDLAERELGWPPRLLTPLTWQMQNG